VHAARGQNVEDGLVLSGAHALLQQTGAVGIGMTARVDPSQPHAGHSRRRGSEHFQREVTAGRGTHEREARRRALEHERGSACEVRLGHGDNEWIGQVSQRA